MTILVIAADKDTVVLAADTLWINDNELVFYQNKIVPIFRGTKQIGAIATAGDAAHGIRFENSVIAAFKKTRSKSKTDLEILVGVIEDKNNNTPTTLLVLNGVGYSIDSDGLVLERTCATAGAGEQVAYGAMWRRRGTARSTAVLGCKAAMDLVVSCGGNITIFEMPVHSG